METKVKVFTRKPPGDRWVEVGKEDGTVYVTLTEALEYYYQATGTKQYYIDASEGAVYVVAEVPDKPQPPKKFSIYGDY